MFHFKMFRSVPTLQSFIIVLGFCLLPVTLWATSLTTASFSTLSGAFYKMGEICGILGASLFALNFVLTTRFKFIEDFFNGLNRVYLYHHNIGAFSFIFLVLHPIFLSFPSMELSFSTWLKFFLPGYTRWPQLMGELALYIVVILLVITFFIKLPYEFWKKTHQYLGVALLPAILHIAYTHGIISVIPGLRLYMLGLYVLAIFAFLYRTAFGKFFVKKSPYSVSRIVPYGKDIIEVYLSPKQNPLNYYPGQFVFITFLNGGSVKQEAHPFSITSAKDAKELSVGIKMLGDFTESLKTLSPKTDVLIEGAYGRFLPEFSKHKQIWVAGGIGITPFLSVSRSLLSKSILQEVAFDIVLYYTVSKPEEAVYLSELQSIQKRVPGLRVIPYFSDKEGRITAERIHKDQNDLHERSIFLCGPVPMMKSLRSQLRDLGIKNMNIHSEEFQLI